MNKLKIFENDRFGKINVQELDGEVYFIGKEIANILEYQNGSRDIKRHVEPEDIKSVAFYDGKQIRNVIAINESGLYSMILSSKMKKAREFKHWITSKVLPSIRQNGLYAKEELLDNPDMLLSIVQKLKEEKDKRQALEEKIEADKDKVMLAEAIETNKASIMIKDLAMILYTNGIKVGQNRLFEILRNEGYLCSAGMYKNKPTQKSLELGIMEFKEHSIKHSSGYNSITFVPLITGKGQGYFVKHFLDKKFNV